MFNSRIDSRDFRVLLYEWKSDHNAAAATRNIKAAFEDGLANKRTVSRCYTKFESGDLNLTNENHGRLETVANNEVLRAIVEQSPGNAFKYYAEEPYVTLTTISRHLKRLTKF
ncbi:hypothetical protein TNCT_425781 [Trichonephila clavata]|uniref:Mos1 transposase HTH domain-containing protein n=1 Tax=Trichonephila clavata TaxID=2740835 RepID=A0A8X6JGK6_TRICU|nr:hypothetical protein TNCT_425781 [Trichonephila clavata]